MANMYSVKPAHNKGFGYTAGDVYILIFLFAISFEIMSVLAHSVHGHESVALSLDQAAN